MNKCTGWKVTVKMDNNTAVAPSSLPTNLPATTEDQECKAMLWWIISFVSLFQMLHCISVMAATIPVGIIEIPPVLLSSN